VVYCMLGIGIDCAATMFVTGISAISRCDSGSVFRSCSSRCQWLSAGDQAEAERQKRIPQPQGEIEPAIPVRVREVGTPTHTTEAPGWVRAFVGCRLFQPLIWSSSNSQLSVSAPNASPRIMA
jgi:hypothetical protein